MYRSRDLAAPELRRRKMRYTSGRDYPWQAFSFSEPIPSDAGYGMHLYIQIDPSDDEAMQTVRMIAEQVKNALPGVEKYCLL